MPQITTVDEPVINSIAPTIYIDSVDYESYALNVSQSVNKYKIYFSFVDENNSWINNSEIFNSLKVNFRYFDPLANKTVVLFEDSLANIKNKGFINNNFLYGFCQFDEPSNITSFSFSASCGNDLLTGDTVVESLKINNSFVSSSISSSSGLLSFPNITKIRNYNLLKLPEIAFSASLPSNKTGSISDINVSYSTNKKAALGTIINLEKVLEQNSKAFNYFKNYPFFKEQILKNSKILSDKTYFSKKNLTLKSKSYTKIENPLEILKFDDSDSVYYITTADNYSDSSDKSKYGVKLNLTIEDYTYVFYENLKQNFSSIKTTLTSLKLLFLNNLNNKQFLDINQYIFTTQLSQDLIEKIEKAINDLLPIFKFFNSSATDNEIVLFLTNCFHPLFTNISALERLEKYVNNLEKVIITFFKDSGVFANDTALKKLSFVELEKIFSFVDSNGRHAEARIDYNFEKNYGYEVISSDNFDIRSSEDPVHIKEYSSEYLSTRKALEINKYFSRSTVDLLEDLNFFSLSKLDLGSNTYDFSLDANSFTVDAINEAYFRILEYNKYNFSFNILESSYFQLANNNFLVKTISNKNNISVNNLQKTTIFDPNLDSKQDSLEFLSSTGIYDLVRLLDDTKLKETLQFSLEEQGSLVPHYFARTASESQFGSSKFTLSAITNIDLKAKSIMYYNTIFYNKTLFSGSNYVLYELQELDINEIFNKKLKLFNKFYLIKIKNPESIMVNPFIDLKQALNFSYLPKYINRTTIPAKFNLSTELL